MDLAEGAKDDTHDGHVADVADGSELRRRRAIEVHRRVPGLCAGLFELRRLVSIGELRRCIRLNLDCADVCSMTASVLSRQLEPELGLIRSVLQACAEACRVCGGECE